MLTALIFSRDRALQLDAALRSYLLHCQDAACFDLFVLYTTSSEPHTRQYAQLVEDFQGYPFIHFLREGVFRREVLGLLAERSGAPRWRVQAFRWLLSMGHHLGGFGNLLLGSDLHNHVLFLVDDNLFVSDFRLQEALDALAAQPRALGFSLRLGENTLFSYMADHAQAKPLFEEARPGILCYDWTTAEYDFAYPLEVSSSILRIAHVLPNLNRRWFVNPNWLESRLAAFRGRYRASHPRLLCFTRSVTFCAPVNRVEPRYQNRAGMTFSYTTEFLAGQFAAGKRIDVAAYGGLIPQGCHQEVELVYKER